ncbi:MAG: phosphatase PAP2 family protein [Terriglobia bacterium]
MSECTALGLARPHPILSVCEIRTRLVTVEWIALAFLAYMILAAFAFHLAAREIGVIITLNTLTFATLMALRRNRELAPWLVAAADLFPAVLILVAYRESGMLLTPDLSHRLDLVFIHWDRVLLQRQFVQVALHWGAPWVQRYLELAYLLCYPLVPLGVGAIHLAIQRSAPTDPIAQSKRAMDNFWSTVLLATLFCYVVYPFFPLTPPRVLFGDVPGPHVEPLLRQWNFWLLHHYSVQACIFPSGHVAAATAVALAVRKRAPGLGALFLILAASVALATVYGRYHYAADAVAGALVGVAAYAVSNAIEHWVIE